MSVAPGGYAWWYVDAISDDGACGVTLIAFIGSVFSPYYAWSKARDPFDHCALNVALYGPDKNRWAMTERKKNAVSIERETFRIGPSHLAWDDGALVIHINETTAPIPSSLRGRVRVTPAFLNDQTFTIDKAGRHRWCPIAPSARVDVDFEKPALRWSGHGYLDTNTGEEPLEQAFRYWDWSRTGLPDGGTAILYNTDLWTGDAQSLALKFAPDGSIEDFAPPPGAVLPDTKIWRIARRTRADREDTARIVRTLEDTPFYSRSMIETELFGAPRLGMHETFSGARLRSPVVKAMLPFRMPRL
ncbi:MAG: carotenoid 1,2-hydratase [Pseudomonadota bacterium]